MQTLVLSRHGNTFMASDKIVWVGARNDLPLVPSGIEQANHLANAYLSSGITPKAVYCGPLKRTRHYAEIVRERLGIKTVAIIDERLNELDYGEWSGLSESEIIEKFGREDLDQWNKHGNWPKHGAWGSSDQEIQNQVRSFVDDLCDHSQTTNVLIISSNGRLRYFLKLLPELYRKHSQKNGIKVATGKVSVLSKHGSTLDLICWNLDPYEAIRTISTD